MTDLEKAARGVKIAVDAVDAIDTAIRMAVVALGRARTDLKAAEAELAEFEDRLAKDRAGADDRLDRKFDDR